MTEPWWPKKAAAPVNQSPSDQTARVPQRVDDDEASGEGPTGRPKLLKKSKRVHWRVSAEDKAKWQGLDKLRYKQWGWLRHQTTESTHSAVYDEFNGWKKKFEKLHILGSTPSATWAKKGQWLYDLHTVEAMTSAWRVLDTEARRVQWPLVMLSTMNSSPRQTTSVLIATMSNDLPGYAVTDVIMFLVEQLDLSTIPQPGRETNANEVLQAVSMALEDMPRKHIALPQAVLGKCASKLPATQVLDLFNTLKRVNYKLHLNTKLQIASKLARYPPFKHEALEILKQLIDEGIDLNEARFGSVVTSLLLTRNHSDEPFHSNSDPISGSASLPRRSPEEMLQYLIDRGFSPNIINLTAILDSLCWKGNAEEAIRLAKMFSESGMQLDERVHRSLQRGAKDSLKAENVAAALQLARASDSEPMNMLNSALHSISYFAERERKESQHLGTTALPIFLPMLRAFAKKFELESLQRWIPHSLNKMLAQNADPRELWFDGEGSAKWAFETSILPVVDDYFSTSEQVDAETLEQRIKLQPTASTLAIMLRAYIRSSPHVHELMSFYTLFKSRFEEEGETDILVKQILKTGDSVLHDAIILTLSERPRSIRLGLQVFGDMLKEMVKHQQPQDSTTPAQTPLQAPSQAPSQASSRKSSYPPPTIFTYSILLRGLFHQRETLLANQIDHIMREQEQHYRAIDLNLVTYNTLLRGHASRQDVGRTVGALQELEAAGFQADGHTFRGFERLRDQKRALERMEGIIEANRRYLESDE